MAGRGVSLPSRSCIAAAVARVLLADVEGGDAARACVFVGCPAGVAAGYQARKPLSGIKRRTYSSVLAVESALMIARLVLLVRRAVALHLEPLAVARDARCHVGASIAVVRCRHALRAAEIEAGAARLGAARGEEKRQGKCAHRNLRDGSRGLHFP
jgi:hypothetical protein